MGTSQGVGRKAKSLLHRMCVAARCRVAQEFETPSGESRYRVQPQLHGRARIEKRFEQVLMHARAIPRIRKAGCQCAAVGMAGARRQIGFCLQENRRDTVSSKFVQGRDTDDAPADHDHLFAPQTGQVSNYSASAANGSSTFGQKLPSRFRYEMPAKSTLNDPGVFV